MKFTHQIFSIPLFALLAVAQACSTKSETQNLTVSFSTLTGSKTYSLTSSAEAFGIDDDLQFVDSVSLLLPSYIGKNDIRPLQDSIFNAAFDTTAIDYNALLKAHFSNNIAQLGYEASLSDTPIDYTHAASFNVVKGFISGLTPQLLTYCVTIESMMPLAAHGMRTRAYINYNIDDAVVLTLRDLFTPEGMTALPALIAKRASDQEHIIGPTDVDALPDNGNFYISQSGQIVFAYQPYEIASYAQGFIDIAFFPYELISYFTPFAIDMFGLNDIATGN